jgi:hypothetical protein
VLQGINSNIICSNGIQPHLYKYDDIKLNSNEKEKHLQGQESRLLVHVTYFQVDNTYATIQHPTRRGSLNAVMSMGGEDMGDYATLTGGMALHNDGSAHSSIRGTPRDVRTFKFGILHNIRGYGLTMHSC